MSSNEFLKIDKDYDNSSNISIVNPSKEKNISVFTKLEKHFDEVLIIKEENFSKLILRDFAKNKGAIKYVTWLEIYIANSYYHYTKESFNEYISNMLEQWIHKLKGFEKTSTIQLSLFGEEFEEKPKPPSSCDKDKTWTKYYNEIEKINKKKIDTNYTFFDIVHTHDMYGTYPTINFIQFLPKNNDEMVELCKKALDSILNKDVKHGRFENVWWNNEYDYIKAGNSYSEYELITRFRHMFRLFLLPYTDYSHVVVDLSFSCTVLKEQKRHRCYFDFGKINWTDYHWNGSQDITYNIHTPKMISFLKDRLKVCIVPMIKDEEAFKLSAIYYFNRINIDIKEVCKRFKNHKELKAYTDKMSKEETVTYVSNGRPDIDGYKSEFYYQGKNAAIVIYQKKDAREQSENYLNVDIDEYNGYIAYNLKGNELYKKVFELFTAQKQYSLFDL